MMQMGDLALAWLSHGSGLVEGSRDSRAVGMAFAAQTRARFSQTGNWEILTVSDIACTLWMNGCSVYAF